MGQAPKVRAREIAQHFVYDVLTHPQFYVLRYRCVVKITAKMVQNFIKEHYPGVNFHHVPRAVWHVRRLLKALGFRELDSSVDRTYYFKPPSYLLTVCAQVSVRVSEATPTQSAPQAQGI